MHSLGNVDESLKEQLINDYKSADISDLDKMILAFTEKLTLKPASIDRAYIDFLKTNGMDDLMIHDAVQVISYFNYVNRLADGLGIEVE